MYRSRPPSSREQFLDQFEPDGSDWLYRHRMTGAAYRVTDVEKDAFVAVYDRHQRRFAWAMAVIYIVASVVVLVPPLLDARMAIFPKGLSSNLIWIILLFNAVSRWIDDFFALGAPLKQLQLRAPVAPAWSRQDRQRLALQQLPLTVVVGTATITFLALLYFALERPALGPISVTLIAASIVALTWAIVQGTRKWRYDRRDYAANNLI